MKKPRTNSNQSRSNRRKEATVPKRQQQQPSTSAPSSEKQIVEVTTSLPSISITTASSFKEFEQELEKLGKEETFTLAITELSSENREQETTTMSDTSTTNEQEQELLSTTSSSSEGETSSNIEAISGPHTMDKEEKFTFRTPKNKLNALGEPEEKRAPVVLTLPIPTWNGFVDAVSKGPDAEKIQSYVLSLIEDAVIEAARSQVSPAEGDTEATPVNSQDQLDLSKLTLTYLANEPKTDRRGRGIDKETWEAFEADYVTIMPDITGRTPEQVKVAAGLFSKKLVAVKTNKPVLKMLEKRLEEWYANTPNGSDFQDVYTFLTGKLNAFLTTPERDLASIL
jgi:hypothetical protein